MTKPWSETVEAHRRGVRDAILDAAAPLMFEHGLRSVTMAQIAEGAGIGRATLYKYFPGVEAILVAWHERRIAHHLEQLSRVGEGGGTPGDRLAAVLEHYALIVHTRHGTELGALLHRGEHVARAQQQVVSLMEGLLAEAAAAGEVRDDVPPGELAVYSVHALAAAGSLPSEDGARRLVSVVLAGLRAGRPELTAGLE